MRDDSLALSYPFLIALSLSVICIDTSSGTDAKQSAGPTSGDNIGTAAIGETSTYSSHHLRKGDPIGNVADTSSNDPTTYRMPEHIYGSSNAGVPAGAAGTAASLAFNKDQSSKSRDRRY